MDGFEEAQNSGAHYVWINENRRIASSHEVEGYVIHTFANYKFFMKYIQSLQERSLNCPRLYGQHKKGPR